MCATDSKTTERVKHTLQLLVGCPFCGDDMFVDNSDSFKHRDGSGCIIGIYSWHVSAINLWNKRTSNAGSDSRCAGR